MRWKNFIQTFGPGLLFASAAIGTSHLILSTQAGANYGLIMGLVILVALVVKYPFFEFGPRYAIATGKSLLSSYGEHGKWGLVVFIVIIGCSMFAVVGAVGAASAGLLNTFLHIDPSNTQAVTYALFAITAAVLIIGRYSFLDNMIKVLSILLFAAVMVIFIAVLIKGPIDPQPDFIRPALFETDGLLIIIGLMGFMPVGLEASAFSSLWTVKKIRETGYHPSLKESLFDFNLGYGVTTLLAFMFLVIGAFTVYGSGQTIGGSPVVFSKKLVNLFTSHTGPWAFSFVAIGAFGAIYGTLITAWDAFARSFAHAIDILRSGDEERSQAQEDKILSPYALWITLIGIGGLVIIGFLGHSLGLLLNLATAISFLCAPIIAFLNLRGIRSLSDPSFRPPRFTMYLAYTGLLFMALFAIYYLGRLMF